MATTADHMPNNGQWRPKIKVAMLVVLPVTLFIIVSHLAILPAQTRQQLMVLCTLLCALLGTVFITKLSFARVTTILVSVIVVCVLTSLHNSWNVALSDYAVTKRIYFFFIFISCFFLFPMAIGAVDPKLENLIPALVFVSLMFAVLAFTSPTGHNIRRSGIDLNPLLHAKLLFFPALVLLARGLSLRRSPVMVGIALLCAISCIKTGSRGPLLVFFLLYLFDRMLTIQFEKAMRGLGAIAVMGLLMVSVLQILPPEMAERFTLASLTSQSHEGDRLFLFSLAIELITNNPNGIGMGNMSGFFWLNAPHNIILEAILDLGIVFALPYLAVLFFALGRAVIFLKSDNQPNRFLGGWFLFYFGNSMMGGEMSFPSMLLYIPMGLLLLAPREPRNTQRIKP